MTTDTRRKLLRFNALFLLIASTGGFCMDVAGSFFGRGVEVAILNNAPGAGIGLIEAHGLAFILGLHLLWAEPKRSWHLTGFGVHLLLGSANLAFWQFFVVSDTLIMGVVTTVFHWIFVALHLAALISVRQKHANQLPLRS
jgi:hypothetical protein